MFLKSIKIKNYKSLKDVSVDFDDTTISLAKIQEEIDKQNTIKSEIAQLRAKIDDIIESAITQ